MVKLCIPVRVRRSFQSFLIGLQAIVHLMQKFSHHPMACPMSHATEFGRQLPHAFARPSQRRLRIAAGNRLYERFQITLQRRVLINGPLPPRSFSPNSLAAHRRRRGFQIGDSADHSASGQTAGSSDDRHPAKANRPGFSGCDQAPRALVQNPSQDLELPRQGFGI
jgi:hypothetical protein